MYQIAGLRPFLALSIITMSFAGGFLAVPGAWAQEDACEAGPAAKAELGLFRADFAGNSTDMDGDGLPDRAGLDLLVETACNINAPAAVQDATDAAYNANLVIFDAEPNATSLADLREIIAMLPAMSAGMETTMKTLLAGAGTSFALVGDYVTVTCASGVCMPTRVAGKDISEEFEVFSQHVRATNEPYSATGDLDEDTTDNLTEYNNVMAQGGNTRDFVIAATSSDLDGTDPIRTPGGSGSCVIATAAYGTPLAREIDVLRQLRDRFLLTQPMGAAFTDAYYRLSPPIADLISQNTTLAGIARMGIVPIVWMAKVALSPHAVWIFGSMPFAGAGWWMSRRRRQSI